MGGYSSMNCSFSGGKRHLVTCLRSFSFAIMHGFSLGHSLSARAPRSLSLSILFVLEIRADAATLHGE